MGIILELAIFLHGALGSGLGRSPHIYLASMRCHGLALALFYTRGDGASERSLCALLVELLDSFIGRVWIAGSGWKAAERSGNHLYHILIMSLPFPACGPRLHIVTLVQGDAVLVDRTSNDFILSTFVLAPPSQLVDLERWV